MQAKPEKDVFPLFAEHSFFHTKNIAPPESNTPECILDEKLVTRTANLQQSTVLDLMTMCVECLGIKLNP